MTTAQHTQTPWVLTTVPTSCGICHKIGPFPPKPGTEREMHACVYADYPGNGPHDEEILANARLIAAAPELLAALTNLRNIEFGHSEDDICKIRIEADAAIAKATGAA